MGCKHKATLKGAATMHCQCEIFNLTFTNFYNQAVTGRVFHSDDHSTYVYIANTYGTSYPMHQGGISKKILRLREDFKKKQFFNSSCYILS